MNERHPAGVASLNHGPAYPKAPVRLRPVLLLNRSLFVEEDVPGRRELPRLLVNCTWRVVAVEAEEGGRIRPSSGVTSLEVTADSGNRHLRPQASLSESGISLTPF